MNEKRRILVVDDETKILNVIKAYLEKEGFDVLTANDGEKAMELFNNIGFSLVILDLMLPKISGEKICAKLRTTSDVPIIMLTAKVEENDKIEGLSLGADDYVTKPFSPKELVLRVKALLRRSYKDSRPLAEKLIFNDGDLEVDIEKMVVKKKGVSVNFTTNEFKLLVALLTNPGQVFTREQLIQIAFGDDYEGFDRTIDTHIKNIRQKIEENLKFPEYILTVYGMGYKFGGNKICP